MRPFTPLPALLLFAAPLRAGAPEDLQAYLKAHPGKAPIRLKVSGEFRQVMEDHNGKATVLSPLNVSLSVAETPTAFTVTWDPKDLAEAVRRSPAEDLGMGLPNPAHASAEWLDPLCLSRITSPVRTLQRLLEVGQVKEVREETYGGRPARRLTLGFASPVPERYRGHANTTEGTSTIWVAPDGAPLASEVTVRYQGRASRMSGTFSRVTVQKATYGLSQDRVFAATYLLEDRETQGSEVTRQGLTLRSDPERP